MCVWSKVKQFEIICKIFDLLRILRLCQSYHSAQLLMSLVEAYLLSVPVR